MSISIQRQPHYLLPLSFMGPDNKMIYIGVSHSLFYPFSFRDGKKGRKGEYFLIEHGQISTRITPIPALASEQRTCTCVISLCLLWFCYNENMAVSKHYQSLNLISSTHTMIKA